MRTLYLRLLVLLAAAVGLALAEGPAHRAEAEPTAGKLTVVVLVVDSLMPEELGQTTPAAPNLTAFRDAGTSYSESRSVFAAETIPNHVAMMTGVYPDRSGIPGNTYWNRSGEPTDTD